MSELGVEEAGRVCERIIDRVSQVFVGNRPLLRKLLAAALANGHVLFEDYPGLGKIMLAKVFTRAIGSETRRVQFTPDVLPADIVGPGFGANTQASSSWSGAPYSPMFCSLMKSIGRPPKCRRRCLKRWKNVRLPLMVKRCAWIRPSW